MPGLQLIERIALGVIAAATLVLVALGYQRLSLGLAIGGGLATLNFFALRTLMRAIASADHPPRQALLSLLLMVKFALMGAAIFALINFASIDPAGMLLGLSIVVASILVEGFRSALRGGTASQE